MKKLFLTLGVTLLSLTSYGQYQKVLYNQTFENVLTPEEAGWTYGAAASITSDGAGKMLELNNNGGNGRSGQCSWGADIYLDEEGKSRLENGIYTMTFEFMFNAFSSNQYNGCVTVFTNHTPVVANEYYRIPWTKNGDGGVWDNFILDMTQNEADKSVDTFFVNASTVKTETPNEEGGVTTTYSVAAENPFTFVEKTWYTATMIVNTEDRTVEYTIENFNDAENSITGTLTVPAINPDGSEISMFAEGMFVKTARTTCDMLFDNIKITCETADPYANVPTVALTRIGYNDELEEDYALRGYTISFGEMETLHIVGTDGTEITSEWDEYEGNYNYTTTTSGTLKVWTTCDGAKSDVVETVVDCNPISLPAATAAISAVNAGYGKTYVLSVDNSETPLRPTISMDYVYTGEEGENLEGTGKLNGDKVQVTKKGSLVVTTKALGYVPTKTTIENDIEFEVKKKWDFARMTDDEIKASGLSTSWTILNSNTTSGFNNWSARKRLFYYDKATETTDPETGELVYDKVYPFGFIAEDNTTNVIEYSLIDNASITDADVDGNGYFEGLTIFPKTSKGNKNFGMIHHVGIYNDQTNDNNNNIIIKDLDATDYVVVNYINNYGGNSTHPVVSTVEEYYAQLEGENAIYVAEKDGALNEETGKYNVTHALYRVDTACNSITIFKPGETQGVEGVESEVAGDNYYYTIDGLRLDHPNRPGLYIHNGKKIIVK